MSEEKKHFNAIAGQAMAVVKISATGIHEFQDLLKWDKQEQRENFLKSGMAVPFLDGLMQMGLIGRNLVVECLSDSSSAKILRQGGNLDTVTLSQWMESFNADQKLKVLASQIFQEEYTGDNSIEPDLFVKWISDLDSNQKAFLFSQSYIFGYLTSDGGKNDIVMDWMKEFTQAQRAAIILSDRSYRSFLEEHAAIWLPWVQDLTQEERVSALTSDYLISDLGSVGKIDLAVKWIEQIDTDTKVATLYQPYNFDSLCENGQSEKVTEWMNGFSPEQKLIVLRGENIQNATSYMQTELLEWMDNFDIGQKEEILLSKETWRPSNKFSKSFGDVAGTDRLEKWLDELPHRSSLECQIQYYNWQKESQRHLAP